MAASGTATSSPAVTTESSAESMSLGAVMADEQGKPFSPAAFESIGGELSRLYEALSVRDLAAGSAAARRLFS